jgi:hypothetical protein
MTRIILDQLNKKICHKIIHWENIPGLIGMRVSKQLNIEKNLGKDSEVDFTVLIFNRCFKSFR